MSNIECSTLIEIPQHNEEVIDEVSTSQVKSYTEELTIMHLPEDQLNEIPSSTIEIHHIGAL